MFFTLLAAVLPASIALGVPLKRLDTSQYCGTWDTIDSGAEYEVFLDQWGASGATSGQSCASIMSYSDGTIAWVDDWTWTGGTGIKSFTNVQLNDGVNQQLSAITSMPVCLILLFHMAKCHRIC